MEYNKAKTGWQKAKVILGGLCCFVLLTFSFPHVQAQSFSDFFGQSKKQIQDLEKQIAALNALETSIRQGYNIAKNEWGSIKNWKYSEYNLHQGYYNSLSQVNPLVKNSTDLSTIQTEQQGIISQFNGLDGLNGLTAQEQSYIGTVQQNLLSELNKDLAELQTVLTPGQLVMSDDERIKRINKVTATINDKYVFTCTFCRQVRVLVVQRNGDSNDAVEMGNLYGINP